MVYKIPVVTLAELKAAVGTEGPELVSPPVSASDIRKFALAVYWPEMPPRLFWDEEYARQTRWGGIIAPQEFNPFAWPISGPGFLPYPFGFMRGARAFNGGTTAEYGVPMRPGDVIRARQRIVEVAERRGRSGPLIFEINESVWRNQHGEVVKKARGTQVHVLPEGGLP